MIDVVFLLLVFFMLAARFGAEIGIAMPTGGGSDVAEWVGGPRLVEVGPDELRLNGRLIEPDALPAALQERITSPDDPILLRAMPEASLQRLLDVVSDLGAAGFTRLRLVAP